MAKTQAKTRAVGWLALACVFTLIVHSGKPYFSNASKPPRGIADPVIGLQLARNVDEVDAVLGEAPSPDREAMRIKQYIDFGFIASYAALYIALALMLRSRAAMAAAVLGMVAAACDTGENCAILRILDVPLGQTTQAMADSIRHFALAKWALAFAVSTVFGILFWISRRPSWRIIAALNFAAAAIGFYGLYNNAFIVWATLPLFSGLVAMVAVFLRFR